MGTLQGLSQLAVMVVTVPGSLYMAEGWRGDEAWADAQERAKGAEVSLIMEDYAPPKLKEGDPFMENAVFRAEIEAPREKQLTGWSEWLAQRPEVKRGRWQLNPATGRSPLYQEYFKVESEEAAAREKVAEIVAPFERRFDAFGKALLSKPAQTVYASLLDDQDAASDYLVAGQGVMRFGKDLAVLAIRSNDGKLAIQRIRVIERMAETFRASNLIGALLDRAGKSLVDRVIWEGVRLRVWDGADLKLLEELVSKREYEENLKESFFYEAAWLIDLLQKPGGMEGFLIFPRKRKTLEQQFDQWWFFEGGQGWRDHRKARAVHCHVDMWAWFDQPIEKRGEFPVAEPKPWWSPVSKVDLAFVGLKRAATVLTKVAPTRDRIVLAAIACELRFLKEGNYPESLADLKLPFPLTDLADPEFGDLVYKLGPRGRPVIWSAAEEERDEEVRYRGLRWQFFESTPEKKKR